MLFFGSCASSVDSLLQLNWVHLSCMQYFLQGWPEFRGQIQHRKLWSMPSCQHAGVLQIWLPDLKLLQQYSSINDSSVVLTAHRILMNWGLCHLTSSNHLDMMAAWWHGVLSCCRCQLHRGAVWPSRNEPGREQQLGCCSSGLYGHAIKKTQHSI